jgi:hypothetical protein
MNVGSAHNWIWVLEFGVFWGLCMAIFHGPRKAPDGSKSRWSWADGVSLGLLGLSLGVVIEFHGQAFHMPLVILVVVAFGTGLAINWLAPLKPPLGPPPVDKSPYRF